MIRFLLNGTIIINVFYREHLIFVLVIGILHLQRGALGSSTVICHDRTLANIIVYVRIVIMINNGDRRMYVAMINVSKKRNGASLKLGRPFTFLQVLSRQ